DPSGSFSLEANTGDVIIISAVGYTSKEITVNGSMLAITLSESKTQLNQVVVTALGIKRQARSLGYSTTELNGDKFTQSRETNLGNALSGQVAGVAVS